jgi:uncharacterized Zn-binding protein involved in type VI secretion
MPAVCVQGSSLATGHGCDAVTVLAIPPQIKITVSGILAAIVGTPTVAHLIPVGRGCGGHGAFLNAGSSKVRIGGIPIGRIGDSADAGAMISGSVFVTAGG